MSSLIPKVKGSQRYSASVVAEGKQRKVRRPASNFNSYQRTIDPRYQLHVFSRRDEILNLFVDREGEFTISDTEASGKFSSEKA